MPLALSPFSYSVFLYIKWYQSERDLIPIHGYRFGFKRRPMVFRFFTHEFKPAFFYDSITGDISNVGFDHDVVKADMEQVANKCF